MSLTGWLNDRMIVRHRPAAGEIAELLHICDRDLEKAKIIKLGPDWPIEYCA
jgi:hypothetical protein